MAAEQLAEMIVRAAGVTQSPASTPAQRQEAVVFLESLKGARKAGEAAAASAPDLSAVVGAAAALTRADRPLDVQVSAYALLTHAVRHRWDDLAEPERQAVGQLAYQHLGDGKTRPPRVEKEEGTARPPARPFPPRQTKAAPSYDAPPPHPPPPNHKNNHKNKQ
jgi:hypothetical protein